MEQTPKLSGWRIVAVIVVLVLAFAAVVGVFLWSRRGAPADSSSAPGVSSVTKNPASSSSAVEPEAEKFTSSTFAMDTVVTQTAYGPNAEKAMQEVNVELDRYDDRLSVFETNSDIARINAAAGKGGAEVSEETANLLRQALELSAQSDGAFAISIAPVTLAWGVTSDRPRIVDDDELAKLLPLVNDSVVVIEGNHVTLPVEGMALDLGGIAKGAACSVAAGIYEKHGIQSALLNIGGNVYAYGDKPDGTLFRIGFRDPEQDQSAYIASFQLKDEVIAVSGGYNRYFEAEGERFIHIFDPRTGKPAESDVVSVGVVDPDGAVADFYSTTLYVEGKESVLKFMKNGGKAIMLDGKRNLYVSESLRDTLQLHEDNYNVEYVAEE